jgi:hypothetical protein
MRHVVSEPTPGAVVRLHPGDWLEIQLTHSQPGADWQVLEQPGCLFPLTDAVSGRPSVLPTGPCRRSLGFLAFGAPGASAQPLRFALVDPCHPGESEVHELSVLVS